jgi:hypothetical protein
MPQLRIRFASRNGPVCTRHVMCGRLLIFIRPRTLHHSPGATPFSRSSPPASTMDANPQRPKGRDGALSSLNMAIDALNLAKDIVDIAPARAAFGSVIALLTMIRVCFLPFCDDGLKVHTHPGLDGEPAGLCRFRVELRRYLQSH